MLSGKKVSGVNEGKGTNEKKESGKIEKHGDEVKNTSFACFVNKL